MSKKYVYMGPGKPFGLPIRHRAILAGEPAEVFPDLAQLFERHRNFQRLFVPMENLASAMLAVKKPGSALSIYSNEISAASAAVKSGQDEAQPEAATPQSVQQSQQVRTEKAAPAKVEKAAEKGGA